MFKIDTGLEEYLIQILDQSKNGIIITDPNKEGNPVIYVNQITCNTFKYDREYFLGKNCSFLHGGDSDQAGLKQMRVAIRKRKDITVTVRNYTKDNELVYNQITLSPIFDKEKNLKYFLGVQRNITKETLLLQENEALQEERLDNAQYNAIGKLSGGLSHEINTPLTVIHGNMEMLKASIEKLEENQDKEYMLEDISLIESNLNRIKNITESMREIADTQDVKSEEINLYRAIVVSLRLTYNKSKYITPIKLQNENFNLDIDREKEKYIIKGDSQKLEQAFISIIDNSLDQLEQKENLETNLLNIDFKEYSDRYELVFSDNGGGVDEKLLPKIFKPFKSDKKHRGLGIGLSIVKKIMDKHGFEIEMGNFDDGAKTIITIPKQTS